MQKPPESESRKIIPRWRELKRTPSRELTSSEPVRIGSGINDELLSTIAEWKETKDLNSALKVVEFNMLGASNADTTSATEFVLSHSNVRDEVKQQITSISRKSELDQHSFDVDNNLEISRIKKQLVEFPRHAILHCEIARLYAALGQINSATKHLSMAIILSPENRYIIRSYVRFFAHQGDFDRALDTFKKVSGTTDPWLLSAQVATADMSENTKNLPIKSIRYLLNQSLPPSQLSELAGSLGTLELKSGAKRKGKKYFQQSALDPNDNALAQIMWANKNENLNIETSAKNVPMSYEARTIKSDQDENFQEAVDQCYHWAKDEPFSINPYSTGSYIAAEFLANYDLALDFAKKGLIANPKNPTLWNNLAYCNSELGFYDKALEYITEAKKFDENDDSNIAITATTGHILMNSGKITEGIALYEKAINLAKEADNVRAMETAVLHLAKELISSGYSFEAAEFTKLKRHFSETGRATQENKRIYKILIGELLEVAVDDNKPKFEIVSAKQIGD